MIGFFFREKIAFFQKIDASEESCQTKITHFSNTLDEWSFPGQSSHRDFVIKSNCAILCTAWQEDRVHCTFMKFAHDEQNVHRH